MFDPVALSQPRDDFGFLIVVTRWNQPGNRLANHLFSRVPKNSFCAAIPARDDAFQGFTDDGVVSRLDNRRQKQLGKLRAFEFSYTPVRSVELGIQRVWAIAH